MYFNVSLQVPFANISINLARFLAGHLPSNTLESDIENDNDEVRWIYEDIKRSQEPNYLFDDFGIPKK